MENLFNIIVHYSAFIFNSPVPFYICKGNWNYFAAVRNEKRNPKLEATHLEKAKELYTKVSEDLSFS